MPNFISPFCSTSHFVRGKINIDVPASVGAPPLDTQLPKYSQLHIPNTHSNGPYDVNITEGPLKLYVVQVEKGDKADLPLLCF